MRIRELFSIPRSKFAHVDDGKLSTDGTTAEDFQALTIEKMQKFTENQSVNFHELFDLTLSKVQENINASQPTVMPLVPVPLKKTRKTTNEKKSK